MKYLLVLLLMMATSNLFAYDGRKCQRFIDEMNGPFLENFLGYSTSTTSYLSSTGDCALIGEAENDKKVFIAHNFDKIKVDSARGRGEYLESYAALSGCNRDTTQYFTKVINRNYKNVFGYNHNYEIAYIKIEKIIRSDVVLMESCGGV